MAIYVILKKDKTYQLGTLDKKWNFKVKKEVKRLKDLDGEYDSLTNFLKNNPEIKYTEETFLAKVGAERAYFLKEESAIEVSFWERLNKKCLSCEKECKQSYFVSIYNCSQYSKRLVDAV
jgi:hypothetical protein